MISKEQKNKIDNFLFELSGEEKKYLIDVLNFNPTIKVDWIKLLEKFNTITGKSAKCVNESVKRKFIARLKEGYSKEDIINTIVNAFNDPYHKENNHKYLTLEYVSRNNIVERYFNQKTAENGKSEPNTKKQYVFDASRAFEANSR